MIKRELKILLLGQNYGTSRHRADALRRIGHEVEVMDPWKFLPQQRFIQSAIGKLTYEIGSFFIELYVKYQISRRLNGRRFDIIWSNQCELVGENTVQLLKKHANRLVTYANDDPFGPRDNKRFSLYRNSLKYYDLMAVVRKPNVSEAYAHGLKKVSLVPFTADEIAHARLCIPSEEKSRWASEVIFVGTWMPKRGSFISRLLQLGVPLSLYGNRWQKSAKWPILKSVWRGPGIVEHDYVKAIQSSRISLGLISKGNRDLHARRSTEIPYIGSLLCAERTPEHLEMYKEDQEAVFWESPEECAEKCHALLMDEKKRKRIAYAGHRRCVASGYLNEPVMQQILDDLSGCFPSPINHMTLKQQTIS